MRKVVWFGPEDHGLLARAKETGVAFSRLVKEALAAYLGGPISPLTSESVAIAVVARLRQEGLVVAAGCGEVADAESLAESQLATILEGASGQYK